jgi:hypothetical protein
MNQWRIPRLAWGLISWLLLGLFGTSFGGADRAKADDKIIDKFKAQDVRARLMARVWFPDAGAGETEQGLALVAKQVKDMARGGFGGLEVAFLSDSTSYTNADAKAVGFGSKNWQKIIRQLLKTANAIPRGFEIDLTITSHWPPILNTIDPNDDAQQQEVLATYKKITDADLAARSTDLPLPEIRTRDFSNNRNLVADFVFVNKFRAATLAKVVSMNGTTPRFEVGSLTDMTAKTTKKTTTEVGASSQLQGGERYAGTPAGVPDRAYATAHDVNYNTVLSQWGPEPSDTRFTGKIDAEGNRRRMADWQYRYATSLGGVRALQGYRPSRGTTYAVGDYVIFGIYSRGTGQIMSGGSSVTQYNRSYAVDYFSDAGVKALIDFWAKKILDAEIIALLKENSAKSGGSSLFEDSLEVHNSTPLWTYNLLEQMAKYLGYDAANYAPILAMNSTAQFDDSTAARRIKSDYWRTLDHLWETEHARMLQAWAKSFNYTFRSQALGMSDASAGAAVVDIPEGDNSTSIDGWHALAAAVHLSGKKLVSNEAITFSANIDSPWKTVLRVLNADASYGVNHTVLHGSAFARTFNGFNNAWPGWNFWNFSSWNARQIWWDDVDNFTGYMARMQAVLQNGEAKVDLAFLGSPGSQQLLKLGYSYDVVSESLLKLQRAVVAEGVLAADGPAYKGLIVNTTRLSDSTVQKLIDYAKGGLPIILFDNSTGRGGYGAPGASPDEMAQKLAGLRALPSVSSVRTQAELQTRLTERGITPAASYHIDGLTTLHRKAAEGDYYFLYFGSPVAADERGSGGSRPDRPPGGPRSGPVPPFGPGSPGGPGPGGPGRPGGGPAGPPGGLGGPGVSSFDTPGAPLVGKTVTLTGTGTPYLLDAFTGDITPIAEYTTASGTVSLKLSSERGEAKIIALISDTTAFPKVNALHATASSGGQLIYTDGGHQLALRASQAGTYSVSLSDRRKATVTVASLPAPASLSDRWKLDLESWGPDPAMTTVDPRRTPAVDPTHSAKTGISFNGVALGNWTNLAATREQLKTLSVRSMGQVSGIGTYSTSFELPDAWVSKQPGTEIGAYLKLTHGSDMVTAVTINGKLIHNLNLLTDTIALGKEDLHVGSNTVTVKLDTTLNNRMNRSGQTYGLTGVQLQPYRQTVIEASK